MVVHAAGVCSDANAVGGLVKRGPGIVVGVKSDGASTRAFADPLNAYIGCRIGKAQGVTFSDL